MTYDQLTNREYAYFHIRGSGRHELITKAIGVEPQDAYSDTDLNPKNGKPFGVTKWRLNSGLDDTEPLRIDSLKALPNDYGCLIRMLPNRGVSPWKCKQKQNWSK